MGAPTLWLAPIPIRFFSAALWSTPFGTLVSPSIGPFVTTRAEIPAFPPIFKASLRIVH